jgi:hypothetical protein
MAFLLVFENESGTWNIYVWCDNTWNDNSKNECAWIKILSQMTQQSAEE